MRILVLNYEYPPLGGGAGVATAVLARGLVERGVAVDVVTAAVSGEPRRSSFQDAEAVPGSGLGLYRVPSRRHGVHQAGILGAASYLVSALPLVRCLLRAHQYDAVHIFFSLPTGALLPLLNLHGVPVVISLRGSDVPGYDTHDAAMQRVYRFLLPLTRWTDGRELRQKTSRRNRAKAEATLEWADRTRRYLSIYEAMRPRVSLPALESLPSTLASPS